MNTNPKSPKYFSQNLNDTKKYETRTQNTKKSGFDKFMLATIGLGLITHVAYDFTRPQVTGEIIGGTFSNKEASQVYLRNDDTQSIDTLILNTADISKEFFKMGDPDDYSNKADELKKQLIPGTTATFDLYNNNQIYRINNTIPNFKAIKALTNK